MLNTVLKWTACFITLSGALATSLQYDPLNIYLLNIGSIVYLIWSVRVKEPSLVVINAGLLLIYIVGLLHR